MSTIRVNNPYLDNWIGQLLGQPDGIAPLNSNSQIDSQYIPITGEVPEYATTDELPADPDNGLLALVLSTLYTSYNGEWVSTANFTPTPSAQTVALTNVVLSGLQTISGYTLEEGDRELNIAQTDGKENGPWIAHSGSWLRPTDAASGVDLYGTTVSILQGTYKGNAYWESGSPAISGTDVLVYTTFSSGAYNADEVTLTEVSNTFSIKTGGVSNTQISDTANIAFSKLAAFTTDSVTQGSTNKYFSSALVLATALTGFVAGSNTAIASTDTVLEAFQKAQGQITARQVSGNYITALSGDVTAAGPGSAAATIANNVVSYAKFQQVSANKLLGNSTGSTANVAEIDLSTLAVALLNDGNASAMRATIGVVINVDVQAHSNTLDALAATALAADRLPFYDSSSSASVTTLTSFARTLLDDSSASVARSTLGLVIGTDVQAQGNYITALSGDVTASGPGSVAATIANNAVSYAKFQQISASKLFGNPTGSLANGSEIGLTSPLVFSGTNLTIPVATTSVNGYLSSTDWTTFNSKQASGNYISALTGDVTATGPGSVAATLSSTGVSANTYGSASLIPIFTVDVKGRISSASSTAFSAENLSNGTTGSGLVPLQTSPTLITPVLGAATATSINKLTFTQPASGSTLTIIDGKTATFSNTLSFSGTDSSSISFGSGGTVAYTANNLSVFASTTSAQLAGIISDETGTGSLVFSASPTFSGTAIFNILRAANTGLSISDTDASHALFLSTQLNLGANRIIYFNPTADGYALDISGNMQISSDFVVSGGFPVTLIATGTTSVTLPTSGTLVNSAVTTLSSLTSIGTIGTGVWQGTAVAIGYGGTGQTTANAGFNALSPMTTLGDTIYGGASGAATRRAGNITTTVMYWQQTGNGSVSSAPAWAQITLPELSVFSSSDLAGRLTDETGTGLAVFATSPTFTTSIICPKIIGGSGTTQTLTYQTTSGVGAAGADHVFLVGNNGSTTALRILNSGFSGFGVSPTEQIDSNGAVLSRGAASNSTASTVLLDYQNAGRILIRGADTSTNGIFKVISTRSDGSSSLTPIQTDTTGLVTLSNSLAVTGATTITANAHSSFEKALQIYDASMTANTDKIALLFGQADSSKNRGEIYFFYQASGSNTNKVCLGFNGTDDIFSIYPDRNFAFNGGAQAPTHGGGAGVLFFANSATAPTSNPTNGYLQYVTAGALKGRGTSGTVTTIGAAEPHCTVCGSDFVLERENPKYGGRLVVCIKCLVEELGQRDYISWHKSDPNNFKDIPKSEWKTQTQYKEKGGAA